MDREEKIGLAKDLRLSPAWQMIISEIKESISASQQKMRDSIKNGKTNQVDYWCGFTDALDRVLTLPEKIERQNVTIIERAKKFAEQNFAVKRILEGIRYGK